jgi:hypothetical protein
MSRTAIVSLLLPLLAVAAGGCDAPVFDAACPDEPAATGGEDGPAPEAACFWKFNPSDPGYAECRPTFPASGSVSGVGVLVDPPESDPLPVVKPRLALIRCPAFRDPAECEMVDADEDPSETAAAWRAEHWIDLSLSLSLDPASFDYLLVFEPGDGSDCGPILDTRFSID